MNKQIVKAKLADRLIKAKYWSSDFKLEDLKFERLLRSTDSFNERYSVFGTIVLSKGISTDIEINKHNENNVYVVKKCYILDSSKEEFFIDEHTKKNSIVMLDSDRYASIHNCLEININNILYQKSCDFENPLTKFTYESSLLNNNIDIVILQNNLQFGIILSLQERNMGNEVYLMENYIKKIFDDSAIIIL